VNTELGRKVATAATADDKGEVTAVVATLGVVDRDREVVAPDSIPNGVKVLLSEYGHSAAISKVTGVPIADRPPVGKGAIFIEGDKAVFKGRYFMSTTGGRETFRLIKELGPDQEWSFSYYILQTAAPSPEQKAAGAKRVLLRLKPFEVSPVIVAGGVGTHTVEVKACQTCGTPGSGSCGCGGTCGAKRPEPRPSDLFPTFPTLERGALARRALEDACAFLGFGEPRPTLHFFVPTGKKSGQALPDRNEIWIDCTLPDDTTVVAVAHEVHHLAVASGKALALDGEAAAEAFGLHLLRRWRERGLLT
jgi:hypothetical protein